MSALPEMSKPKSLIITTPYCKSSRHWKFFEESATPNLVEGHREAGYMVADPKVKPYQDKGIFVELALANKIYQRQHGQAGHASRYVQGSCGGHTGVSVVCE